MSNKPAIVFVHGLIRPPFQMGHSFEYFRGLEPALENMPVSLCFPELPSASTIEKRAVVLEKSMADINADEIYMVGHSMGGLDSRNYLSKHPDDKRIKQLVTVATPHHGSPLADWVVRSYSPLAVLLRYRFADGARALTTQACEAFNHDVPDRDDIEYFSYAASRPIWEQPVWLRLLAKHIGNESNDGQVPVSSAQWGHFSGLLHADHFETSGWNFARKNQAEQRPFDDISFYRRLINGFIKD